MKYLAKTITYYYNLKGEKDQQTVTNVNSLTWATTDVNYWYDYDLSGRMIETQNAQGITYECKYDALGRKIEETDAVGKVTKYYYDPLGYLTDTVEDPTGLNRITSFEYDRFGRRETIISSSDQTDYTYNYLGAITNVDYPNNDSTAYGYDMLGAAIRRTVTKNSQSATTHYKRNVLGKISYKQYTNEVEWTEPNNALPFDEILYDALGNRNIVAYIDGEDDLELNIYSFDNFGNMTTAAETGSDFSSSVSYTYDQRGQVASITYPNDAVVGYVRDALGRIESVSYESKTIVEYGYLGDKVISKTMADADIEYDVTIDALGRVTGETFSNISDSTSFITNSYDYTSYSNRLDERNTVDYAFDTLGKLTAEDATSYTSDALGNPTNAGSDGLTYGLDDEGRVIDVDDSSVDVADYEYDRLGRRSKKTVGSLDTYYVYDIMGNVIAEYEKTGTNDAEWTMDYAYGANGEAVYMQFPQTATMNTELDNFVAFIEAWLCDPNCTTADLLWDYNNDDQIDLIDWEADVNDLDGAFMINGRYLLTDFRNSVIGKVNLDGSVDEIAYDAWGTPTVDAGADLEGLSILWNGYYYDSETDNYYLRNRYYSPLERKFITEDPHGTNPDGTWNNRFGIQNQYSDGYGLQVYVQGDPINGQDSWGLKVIIDNGGPYRENCGLKVYCRKTFIYNGMFTHCDVRNTPGDANAENERWYPVTIDSSPFRKMITRDGNLKSCKCATCPEIFGCVNKQGNHQSNRRDNCQNGTQRALANCCLKAPSWRPSSYITDEGFCVKWETVSSPYGSVTVCVRYIWD